MVAAALVAAALAAVGLGAALGSRSGSASGKVLDIGKAQHGVAQVLEDPLTGYGLTALGSIACNNGINPAVRQGESFTCQVVVDGTPREVTVLFQDDDGTYAVDRPR